MIGGVATGFGRNRCRTRARLDGKMTRMTIDAKNCKSTIIPAIRYRNAKAMIEWLCQAFGFEKKAVYAGADDIVMHAELTFLGMA